MIHLLPNKRNAFIILVSGLIGCHEPKPGRVLPFINQPDYTPEWIDKKDKEYPAIHRIPAFAFYDQDGKMVTEKDVDGKIYVAGFFFTRCAGICPKLTANMKILQQKCKADPDIMFLFHSVTPESDSVPVLNKYAESAGISGKNWRLLTGSRETIYRLARQEYFAGDTVGYYQTGNEFLHTENFMLLDRQRRIRGVYNGTLEIEMQRILEDIQILKQESDD